MTHPGIKNDTGMRFFYNILFRYNKQAELIGNYTSINQSILEI